MSAGPGREGFSLQDRRQELDLLPAGAGTQQKQRRMMLVALALLLAALIVVLVKDRQFWFPSGPTAESNSDEDSSRDTAQTHAPAPSAPATGSSRPKPKQRAAAPAPAEVLPAPPAVTTSRAVLPPLEVEVVAGDQRRTVPSTNNSIKIDLQPKSGSATPSGTANATGHVQLSPDASQVVVHTVQPNYPLLAKQMKVQGAVVLQALIGKEGTIQDLHVVSGPAILSSAAREAVKQWRFRPYVQGGQPVETEARITVNFTISTY